MFYLVWDPLKRLLMPENKSIIYPDIVNRADLPEISLYLFQLNIPFMLRKYTILLISSFFALCVISGCKKTDSHPIGASVDWKVSLGDKFSSQYLPLVDWCLSAAPKMSTSTFLTRQMGENYGNISFLPVDMLRLRSMRRMENNTW
jgi:hypothetical protein